MSGFSTQNPGGGSANAMSDRLTLTARYGMASCLDVSASLGTADLSFNQLTTGYSEYASGWSLAWGAGLRAQLPLDESQFKVVGAVNYLGFQPGGSTGNGYRTISSKYLWHEVMPSLAVGIKAGPVVPYVGAAKPYLFGHKKETVSLNGRALPNAGGSTDFSDGEQSLRGVLGADWKLPQGYSITAEAQTTSKGVWTLSIGVAQVLK